MIEVPGRDVETGAKTGDPVSDDGRPTRASREVVNDLVDPVYIRNWAFEDGHWGWKVIRCSDQCSEPVNPTAPRFCATEFVLG